MADYSGQTVAEILKLKKARIKNAPLGKGFALVGRDFALEMGRNRREKKSWRKWLQNHS
jgi:hypothetical protein